MSGLIDLRSGCRAMMDCAALLMLGTDLPYRQFVPEDVPIAQVDARLEDIGRRAPPAPGVVGNVAATIEAALPMLEQKVDRAHLVASLTHYVNARDGLDDLAVGEPGKPIHPRFLAKVPSECASDDATPSTWAPSPFGRRATSR